MAEQSGEAATTIEKLIETIQADTTSAVESIKQGNERVKEGTQTIAETGEALQGIERQSTKLTANVSKSFEDIGAVDASNEEILSAVAKVKELSGKSTSTADSISAATQEQTATMNEVTEASRTLAELAGEMHSEVAQFKL